MALSSPHEFTEVLVPNGERRFGVPGSALTILSATGAFQFSMGDGPFTDGREGLTYPLPPPERFESLSIRDRSGATNTIALVISFAEIKDSRLVLSAPVQIAGHPVWDSLADDSVGIGATDIIFAADADRREAIIHNLATNVATFRIGDAGTGAANGIPLAPGETLILTTQAEIRAHNPGAVAQSLALGATKGA